MKDFFVPLYKEYFLKFKNGEQDCEIRPAGHRGWTAQNIYPGRWLLISNGYGNYDRIRKQVRTVITGSPDFAFAGVPQWHIDAVDKIYGKRDRWLVAYV